MLQFINERDALVTETIDGLLRCAGGMPLARLDGYPSIKVVLRTDHNRGHVAIISGGGSGHEPAHVGFVGRGMLTAAVCGDVFASPSVDAVLAAIMAVTGKGGCLLIVKNYTGDRLNFGLAAERARSLGKKVEMVIVADDIALPDIAQPRGIAGTLLVHKIAGYYAAKRKPLRDVAAAAQRAAESAVSIGISLGSCTLPGVGRDDRIPVGKAELGLGIHGEPGVQLIPFEGARRTAEILAARLFERVKPAKRYALLLNNLGSTTPLEMGVIANELLASPQGRKINLIVGPAPLMTSLDMHGLSATLLPLKDGTEAALLAPVAAPAWPGAKPHGKLTVLKLPKEIKARVFRPSRNAVVGDRLSRACEVLIANEAVLNMLDSKVGDGDTGSTIAAAARTILKNKSGLPLSDPPALFAAISDVLMHSMGGSSGVLLAIFFAATAAELLEGENWPAALQMGLGRMMEYGGAKPGDRTMVDALRPALAALAANGSLSQAAAEARAGANATAHMQRAAAGRSRYVSSANLAGVSDPGAEAVAMLLESLAESAGS
jgi:dihydroxyacetone kinase